MEKTLFLSLIFSSPIIFWFFLDNILKKTFYKWKYKDYIFDFFWWSSLLMIIFWLLSSITFIWPKISILLSIIIIVILWWWIINNFIWKRINWDDFKWIFLYKHIKQFILIFLYIIWVWFFIGWNLSFFSNITLGSLLIEVIKFIPIFVFIFWTIEYDPDKLKFNYLIFTYFSLILLFFIDIIMIEKLFKYYVPNAPVFLQIFLWFFLLIFLIKNSIFYKIWFFYKDDSYKLKILSFLILWILCIIYI